jgi:gamma-glutamylcyclotransferase (GGCT)/AIG2-like uncharacterized protein YtfP
MPCDHIVLYGSLRRGEAMFETLGLGAALDFVSAERIPGVLYDLGDFPGLVAGDGSVRGELYRVRDPGVWRQLDEYEEYYPQRPERSLFVRRLVQLANGVDAWVYFYNRPVIGHRRIASGEWRRRRSAA